MPFISLVPLESLSNIKVFIVLFMLMDYILMCRWKALDFAELKRSSISFFDIEKPETAVSRWSRARKRAAKVIFSYDLHYNKLMLSIERLVNFFLCI